jgi:hypothetical protein
MKLVIGFSVMAGRSRLPASRTASSAMRRLYRYARLLTMLEHVASIMPEWWQLAGVIWYNRTHVQLNRLFTLALLTAFPLTEKL